MRTKTIKIAGVEYMAVFNNRVLTQMEAAGIKLSEISGSGKEVTNVLTMIRMMIESGSLYARKMNMGDYPTITQEDLEELTDFNDYGTFQDTIAELCAGDRHVDAEPQGNAAADQEQAREN